MGLLCVVSDAEGLSENVPHGKSGWVVPKRNPKELAVMIQSVAEMPKQNTDAIRSFAQKRVEKEFNLEKQQQEFIQFYQDI